MLSMTSSLRDLSPGDDSEADNDGSGTRERSTKDGHEDAYFEKMTVGVREARAWLRGRYVHISAPVIDGVCLLPFHIWIFKFKVELTSLS